MSMIKDGANDAQCIGFFTSCQVPHQLLQLPDCFIGSHKDHTSAVLVTALQDGVYQPVLIPLALELCFVVLHIRGPW